MSQENVELVRSMLPRPDTDMVALFNDDSVGGELVQTWAPLLDPAFVSINTFHGWNPQHLRDYKACAPAGSRASYRTEIEEMIGLGDRVVTVLCDYARREPGAPEVALKSATVWTVRDGRIVRAEFYAGGRAEALQAVGLTG